MSRDKSSTPRRTNMGKRLRKYTASFLHRGKWWVAWTDDVPGALTQGRTIEEARENLKDAISQMIEPVNFDKLPNATTHVVREVIEL